MSTPVLNSLPVLNYTLLCKRGYYQHHFTKEAQVDLSEALGGLLMPFYSKWVLLTSGISFAWEQVKNAES